MKKLMVISGDEARLETALLLAAKALDGSLEVEQIPVMCDGFIDAWRKIAGEKPDILLFDLNLSAPPCLNNNGRDLATWLRDACNWKMTWCCFANLPLDALQQQFTHARFTTSLVSMLDPDVESQFRQFFPEHSRSVKPPK